MTTTPLIITCALVGAELSRDDFPNLPLTPSEIATAAAEAVEAGASIIHLHVRDEEGKPTQRADIFETVSRKIKAECDCILQYSTGGAVGTPIKERLAPLVLAPEMATLSMGSMNFGTALYENTLGTITAISDEIQRRGILPELEIFDYGMMHTMKQLSARNQLPRKYHVDFVLGVPGGMSGTIKDLLLLVEQLPPGQSWSVAGIGKYELPLSAHAIAMGGHVRVGIEDNIYYCKGELAESNAQLVRRIARVAAALERPLANADTARQILGLSRR